MFLHRDSDEVGYVLSGEITFKIGEEVTVGGPGTCAFMPRGVLHAWKHRRRNRPRSVSLHPGRGRRVFRGAVGPADRLDNRLRGQRDPSPPRLADHRSAAFLA
jgi:hypothetical protein